MHLSPRAWEGQCRGKLLPTRRPGNTHVMWGRPPAGRTLRGGAGSTPPPGGRRPLTPTQPSGLAPVNQQVSQLDPTPPSAPCGRREVGQGCQTRPLSCQARGACGPERVVAVLAAAPTGHRPCSNPRPVQALGCIPHRTATPDRGISPRASEPENTPPMSLCQGFSNPPSSWGWKLHQVLDLQILLPAGWGSGLGTIPRGVGGGPGAVPTC